VLLGSYAYFYQAGGANQNSRYDLVRAIVVHHTVRVDGYEANTRDVAYYKGHFYSDKAPGQPLLAVPFSAATRGVLRVIGVKPSSHAGVVAETCVDTLATVAIPVSLGALALWWVAMRLGASQGAGAFAAATFGLATPMFAYATLWWSHGLTAALLIFEFALAVELRQPRTRRRDLMLGAITGFVGGWAAITEFPAAPAAALILGLAVAHSWPRLRGEALAVVAGGLLVPAAVLAVYNAAAFGSPLHFGYNDSLSFALPRSFDRERWGTAGFTYPRAHALWGLLFGTFRGLFPLAPVLFVAPVGWASFLRNRRTRMSGIVAVLIPLYFVLSTSAYYYWDGVNTYGPRLLAGAIPFLCLGVAPVWSDARRALRSVLLVLAVIGMTGALIAVSTNPEPSAALANPLMDELWPAFRGGHLSQVTTPFTGVYRAGVPRAAWNIGEGAGLEGQASLAPLYAFWTAALAVWLALARKRDQDDADQTQAKLIGQSR
jgi:hypothetical protein